MSSRALVCAERGERGRRGEGEGEGAESSEEEEQSRRGAKEQAGRTKSLDIDKEGSEGGARGHKRPPLLQQGSLRTSQSDNALPARVQWAGRALSGWGRGFLSVCLEYVHDPMTGRPRHMTVVAMDGLVQEEPFQVRPRNTSRALKSAIFHSPLSHLATHRVPRHSVDLFRAELNIPSP